jgi:hypothetical protein
MGTPQLVCAGAVVAAAHPPTLLGLEAAPIRLCKTCMNQLVIPPVECAHITYFAVAGLAAALGP